MMRPAGIIRPPMQGIQMKDDYPNTPVPPKMVDLTPTWAATFQILANVLEHGTAEGKTVARAELARIGEVLDNAKEATK